MATTKIGNIARVFGGYAFKSSEYTESGYQIIRIKNVQDGFISDDDKKFIELPSKTLDRFILNAGDILISLTGNIGRVAKISKNDLPAVLNQRVGKLIIESKQLLPDYLYHILKSKAVTSRLIEKGKGIAQKNIGSSDIEDVEIPLPPLEDQQRIVRILDKADSLRQKRKQAIELLDDYLKSVFMEMYGDPVKNPKGWDLKTIEHLTMKDKYSLKRGPFGGSLKKECFVESGYLVYEQFHALNNDFTMERYYIDEAKFQELKAFEVKAGDIIISCSGVYLGKLAIVPKNCRKGVINQALMKISLDQTKMNNLLFLYIFTNRSFKKKFFGNKIGSAMPNFPPMTKFKKFEFICPPPSVQNHFATIVDKVGVLKQKMLTQSKELETQFQALLQKAFKEEL